RRVQRVAAARCLGHVGAGAVTARQVARLEQAEHRLADGRARDREALREIVLVRQLGAGRQAPGDEVVEQTLPHLVDERGALDRRHPRSTASTAWPATLGPPGSARSKIAVPIVKPQAPASSSRATCSSEATEPAAITGPCAAAATARVSATGSADS